MYKIRTVIKGAQIMDVLNVNLEFDSGQIPANFQTFWHSHIVLVWWIVHLWHPLLSLGRQCLQTNVLWQILLSIIMKKRVVWSALTRKWGIIPKQYAKYAILLYREVHNQQNNIQHWHLWITCDQWQPFDSGWI